MLCLHKADMFQTKKLVSKKDLLNVSRNSKIFYLGTLTGNLRSQREMIKGVKKERIKIKVKLGQQECRKWHNFGFYGLFSSREKRLWKKLLPVMLIS